MENKNQNYIIVDSDEKKLREKLKKMRSEVLDYIQFECPKEFRKDKRIGVLIEDDRIKTVIYKGNYCHTPHDKLIIQKAGGSIIIRANRVSQSEIIHYPPTPYLYSQPLDSLWADKIPNAIYVENKKWLDVAKGLVDCIPELKYIVRDW